MKNTVVDGNWTIGQVISLNYSLSEIFYKFNQDFCCGGNRELNTLSNSDEIIKAINLKLSDQSTPNDKNYDSLNNKELINYILNNHHNYIKENIPIILQYTAKIARVHGGNHPELIQLNEITVKSLNPLLKHLLMEETDFFPLILKIDNLSDIEKESLEKILLNLENDHDFEGEAFRRMRAITNDFELPNDACNAYKFTFSKLIEFEKDLHKHVHLENNILFKRLNKF